MLRGSRLHGRCLVSVHTRVHASSAVLRGLEFPLVKLRIARLAALTWRGGWLNIEARQYTACVEPYAVARVDAAVSRGRSPPHCLILSRLLCVQIWTTWMMSAGALSETVAVQPDCLGLAHG